MTWPPPSGPPHRVREPGATTDPLGAAARAPVSLLWPASSAPASQLEDRTLVVALTTLLVVDALGPGLLPDRLHAACITVLLVALAMHVARRDGVRPRLTAPLRVAFLLVVGALVVGIVGGNAAGALSADLYHWSVECFLAFAVMGMLLRAGRVIELRRSFVLATLLSGVIGVAVAVSGQIVRHSIGGGPTSGQLWRLSMNRTFPILMIIGLAVIWRLGDSDRRERRLVAVAALFAAVALLFTLKRVQLIGLLIAIPVLFVGRFALTSRTRMLARSTIPLLGLGLLFIVVPGVGRSVLPALDYSNYATITSVDVRNLQYRDAVDDLLTHPLGHGLGAAIESWVPDGGRVVLEDTNYLHSSYLQAGIQVGLPLLILGVVGILILLARVSAVPIGAVRPEARWLVVFALLGIPVLMVMSLSLVATDTVWFGFLLAVLAFAPLLRRAPATTVDGEQS